MTAVPVDANNVAAPAVRAESFAFTYAGQASSVLCDVSVEVPQSAFAVIKGNTGSGKTTVLRCMAGVLAPAGERAGLMEVFGSECPDPFDVGFVMQDPESQMACDTVLRELAFGLENSGMSPDAMRRRVAEVSMVFGLGSLADARTADLSGGQKQLVNLAAAIAMRPRLLLLDEPTAQLDPQSARQLCDALRVANQQLGVTVIVATHAPELFADLASCAFELREGCVREVAVDSLRFEQKGEALTGAHATHDDPAIRLRDAWFAYERGGAWVLKGLDAAFRPGEVSCIVGSNGCGKTTLLKVIAGILRPQRGNVRNSLNQSQAYLPQDSRLLLAADTVADELPAAFGEHRDCPLASSLAKRVIGAIGTVPLARFSPLDLSGGQQQMLALAKLLSAKPQLLLLDEPVKGLDAESQLQLAKLLRHIVGEGVAVIMATHDLSFASRVADSIALMFDGQIASCASPAEFFADAVFCTSKANAFTVAWDELQAIEMANGEPHE